MKKLIMGLVAVAVLGVSQVAVSARSIIDNVTIKRILIDNVSFGGCMVLLDKAPAVSGLNCPANWVSFSCDGTYGNKDIAFRQLDQAQIAMALNKQVMLIVDDSKKHNTYCYASRIDLY